MGAVCDGDNGCCCAIGEFCSTFVSGQGGPGECQSSVVPPTPTTTISKTRGTHQGTTDYGPRGQRQSFTKRKKDKYRNYTNSYSTNTSTNCVNGVCTSTGGPGYDSNWPPQTTQAPGISTGSKVLLGGVGVVWLVVMLAVPVSIVYIAVKLSQK